MNKYLEKIAQLEKESMRVEDLAAIAKKVGLRREGDWRRLARRFADSTGALKPARERAALREEITGVGNNAVQKIFASQQRARDTDEVLGFISEKTKKILPVQSSLSMPNGLISNPGMALTNPGLHPADAATRQKRAISNAMSMQEAIIQGHGTKSLLHTHPGVLRQFKRISKTKSFQDAEREGISDPMYSDIASRKNLPVSSMGGAGIASEVRKGNPLKNKKDAHLLAREFPIVNKDKLQSMGSPDFMEELQRIQRESSAITGKLSPPMRARLSLDTVGDHASMPQINRRNSIVGMDNTLGVHTQGLVPTHRSDSASHIPFSYQHAYFDINQGGHKAIRRMLKKGLNPEQYGLNSAFLQ